MPVVSKHLRKFTFFERLEVKLLRILLTKRSRQYLRSNPIPMSIMAFDFIGNEISIHGLYEQNELENVFKSLRGFKSEFLAGTVCDIGANLGNHSRFFADKFASVVCFEPNPLILDLLKFNTKHYPNVLVSNKALGDTEGFIEMTGDKSNLGNYSIASHLQKPIADINHDNEQEIAIQITTLDSIRKTLNNLQFIKIDVEGHEHQVLLGAHQCILESFPVIALEQWQRDFIDGKSDSIQFLANLGYKFFWQRDYSLSSRKVIRELSRIIQNIMGYQFEYLETSEVVPPGHYSMLLAIHESKISKIV